MSLSTPILLLAWRRPDTTRKVIDAIRKVAPTQIYVACDGPDPTDRISVENVEATRALIEKEIDWQCTIHRRFSDKNQGCKLGVSSAIQWFFYHIEEGIILEDDCVPHQDFFPYCAELLERFRFNDKIWCISGNNFQDGHWRGEGSYYFSQYNHCWGWASWRRCWNHYDRDLKCWPEVLEDPSILSAMFDHESERGYWHGIWDRLFYFGQPDTWDYQWTFTCLANGGLTALPNSNLVSNIGFGLEATHTTEEREPTAYGGLELFPLKHPKSVERDLEADRYTYDKHFNPSNHSSHEGINTAQMANSKSSLLIRLLRRLKYLYRAFSI